MKIKSVEKGYGEGSIFYSTDQKVALQFRVDKIESDRKPISTDVVICVYRGYIGGNIVFEMGGSIDVTIVFEQ